VGLQAVRLPYLPNHEGAHLGRIGHPPQRPVCGVMGLLLGGHPHDLGFAFICDHGLSAPSGSVMLDAETPRFEEPVPPSSDCIEPNVEVPGGRADPNPIRQQQ
jgi:hypothetical protein